MLKGNIGLGADYLRAVNPVPVSWVVKIGILNFSVFLRKRPWHYLLRKNLSIISINTGGYISKYGSSAIGRLSFR